MTAQVFRHTLKQLGMTQLRAAAFLRVQATTVNRWARGKRKIPGPVAAALECYGERQTLEAMIGNQRMFSTSTAAAPIMTTGDMAPFRRRDNRPPKP